jgi:hypothetical protein
MTEIKHAALRSKSKDWLVQNQDNIRHHHHFIVTLSFRFSWEEQLVLIGMLTPLKNTLIKHNKYDMSEFQRTFCLNQSRLEIIRCVFPLYDIEKSLYIPDTGAGCHSTTKEISIFPLWTFHLYVATFQKHTRMKYI